MVHQGAPDSAAAEMVSGAWWRMGSHSGHKQIYKYTPTASLCAVLAEQQSGVKMAEVCLLGMIQAPNHMTEFLKSC